MENELRQLEGLFQGSPLYDEAADADSHWDDGNAHELKAFFGTETGQKLQVRLNNAAIRVSVAAVKQADNHTYHSGMAAGVHVGISAVFAHFPKEKGPEIPQEAEVIQAEDQAGA